LMRVLAWKKPPRRTRVRDNRLLDCLWPLLGRPLLACRLLDDLPRYWRGA